jgi:hypothetical protein
MTRRPRHTLLAALAVHALLLAACAASAPKADAPASTPDAAPPPAASPPPAPPAASERPFAKTPLEAQTLIQQDIDARRKALWKCVEDLRKKVGDPHLTVTVDIGIDQEGHLIGVADTKHGGIDPALQTCMTDILRLAPFPRSHTGVITVHQVFQDSTVYQ